jgi:alpha,alpha-trehalase
MAMSETSTITPGSALERTEPSASVPIADYGLLADCNSAALVDRNGSIDWLCMPRYDSPAVLSRILDPDAGHWSIRPAGSFSAERRYLPGTLVIETVFTTDGGSARVVDAMAFAPGQRGHDLGYGAPHEVLRSVEGISGSVELVMELAVRPEFGLYRPLIRLLEDGARTFGGTSPTRLRAGVPIEAGDDSTMRAAFAVAADECVGFALRLLPVEVQPAPEPTAPADVAERVADTVEAWRSWEAEHDIYEGPHKELVRHSARVLKGLTYRPTGAIVAAPTTSLPEALGGVRNWDYRYTWLRDATLTLVSMINAGYVDEAEAWRDWLLRAIAGSPEALQIMFGIAGERRLIEFEVPWLAGYEGSAPVRVGNAASAQRQLDVYGEVADALYQSRAHGLVPSDDAWSMTSKMFDWLESSWREPDQGIWEVRGPPRQFTHSKVMAWVAFDRAVKAVRRWGREGPVDRWQRVRQEIHDAVCREGYNADKGAFVQSFGSDRLDASLLLMPIVGFLPATDERVVGTVEAIRQELTRDGLVERYRADVENVEVDGLPPGEGVFLPCSFWLAEVLAMQGRRDEAVALFERLLDLRNDLGLISEEYDPERRRLVGNFPQAFTHLALVDAVLALSDRPPRTLD